MVVRIPEGCLVTPDGCRIAIQASVSMCAYVNVYAHRYRLFVYYDIVCIHALVFYD